jgi:pantoate--beta-alanine ligase
LVSLPTDRTIASLRARLAGWRAEGATIALVPTMGALHAGHIALVREGRRRAKRTVVSIFVNPAQFAPTEDLASYPRDEAADLRKLAAEGVDAVFAPTVAEMYPDGFATRNVVSGPAEELESASRPHFYGGVATVVAKLLTICSPDFAIFGEKDYQQLLVVRRLVADLAIPTEIVGLPTVREADGLALSSRNAYLSAAERATAPRLNAVLTATAKSIRTGASAETALASAKNNLASAGFLVDYLQVRNARTLARATGMKDGPLRLLAAVWLGKTRLIDNVPV